MSADAADRYAEGGARNPLAHTASAQTTILDAEGGRIAAVPPRKKVALVGFASSTRDQAPYDDPSWLICGLNQLYRYMPRADVWFEIHTREMFLADQVRDSNYLGWLQTTPLPVFMLQTFPDIPTSVRFPMERAVELIPGHLWDDTGKRRRDYFQSTPAYMVAWALLEGFEEIGVWGIDLVVGGEYQYQRPNLEFWLGIALARGVKLTIPPESALLKQLTRYGQEADPKAGPYTLAAFDQRIAEYQAKRNEFLTGINAIEGAIEEANYQRTRLELWLKGATPG